MKASSIVLYFLVSSSFIGCEPINKEHKKNTNFKSLADQEKFQGKHSLSEESNVLPKGEWVEYPSLDGKSARAYVVSPKQKSNQYLLLFHEWWGLNKHIQLEADIWQEKLRKVNVIAVDLYDGRVAQNRDEAKDLMQGTKQERIYEIIDAVLMQLPKQNMQMCTMGWCFGGSWALKASIRAQEMSAATVMYYGMPIRDVDKLGKINGDVLFIYGAQDAWINQEVAENFQKDMLQAHKEVNILSFDADHAFANPSSEHYNAKAASKANSEALRYLNYKY